MSRHERTCSFLSVFAQSEAVNLFAVERCTQVRDGEHVAGYTKRKCNYTAVMPSVINDVGL